MSQCVFVSLTLCDPCFPRSSASHLVSTVHCSPSTVHYPLEPTLTTILSSLSRADKRTIVGNLLRTDSRGLGFGLLKWMERDLAYPALQGLLVANNALTAPTETHFAWQPDRVTAKYTFGDCVIEETKTIHDDVAIAHLAIRNLTSRITHLALVFRGDYEGRKASARFSDKGRAAHIDLHLQHRTHIAFAANHTPTRATLRPYPELVVRDLTTQRSNKPTIQLLHDQVILGWRFDFELQPNTSTELTLTLACHPITDIAIAKAKNVCHNSARAIAIETERWERFYHDQTPRFACSDPALEKLWNYIWFVQRSNITRHHHPRFPFAFQMPSKHTYPHLWFWDSAFHALICRWLHNPQIAHDDLRTVALQQLANGMIPHEVYLEDETARGNWQDGDGMASSITQLPIYAHAVWETYRVTRDRALIADLLPALVRYDEWCARERDRDGDGLMSLLHRWEGWDTSPRWDWGMDVEPVDVNAMYAAQKIAIVNIARELGDDALSTHYARDAERTARAIREKMWDADAQTFFDLQGADEMKVRVRTPAAFITLPFGIATREQAQLLITQLLSPELFWSRFPIPTVALDEPSFNSSDYWRGPVWINQNWMVIDGLRRYGRDDAAAQLVQRTLALLARDGAPTSNEYFNPLTGDPLGAVDLGWTGLCNDLIVRHLCGVQPSLTSRLDSHAEQAATWESPPLGQSDWQFKPLDIGLEWYELDLPAQKIRVRFERGKGYEANRE